MEVVGEEMRGDERERVGKLKSDLRKWMVRTEDDVVDDVDDVTNF